MVGTAHEAMVMFHVKHASGARWFERFSFEFGIGARFLAVLGMVLGYDSAGLE